MNQTPEEWLTKLYTFAYFGALGAFASLVGYLVKVASRESDTLTVSTLLTAVLTGVYLGILIGALSPEDWTSRDGIVLLVGATGMKGFEIVSEIVKEALPRWLRRGPP